MQSRSTLSCLLLLCLAASATFAVVEQTGVMYDVVQVGLLYWRLSIDVAQWPGALGAAPFALDANNTCALCRFDCVAVSAPQRLQCTERATGNYAMLIRHPDEEFLTVREANMSRTALHSVVVCLYSELTARQLAIQRQ